MENIYCVKFYDNWADEMDINGIAIITEETKLKLDAQVEKYKDKNVLSHDYYFGTNEYNYYDFWELYHCLTFIPITLREAKILNNFIADMSDIVNNVIEVLLQPKWLPEEVNEEEML